MSDILGCLEDFEHRGLVQDTTDRENLRRLLNKPPATLYAGFDPTADSLHVGSLVPLLALRRMQRWGHRPIVLAGGATGMVGDPSGKSKERNLLDRDALNHNIASVKKQMSAFLDFDTKENGAILVDNAEWFSKWNYLEFLRDIGKHFTLSYMMAKDSVKSRMGGDSGISYTEFSYMLLQAADFLHLFQNHGCTLQIGGSDQWGNMTAGTELIRRTTGKHAHVLTMPLLTKADGGKFGKTEEGTVWLDPERTSPYQLFQYFVRQDDRDVVSMLKTFTFLPLDQITQLAEEVLSNPAGRQAQKALAREVTTLVHGTQAAESAEAGAKVLFGGSVDQLNEADLLAVAADIPRTTFDKNFTEACAVVDLFVETGLLRSKGEVRRLLDQGGIYINNERLTREQPQISENQLLFGRYLLLRAGKKKYHLVAFSAADPSS